MLLDFFLHSPGSWKDLSPSGGGKRGEQLLVFTEHQYVPETGVGEGSAGPTDAEQVVAEDHGSACREDGALQEGLIYAGQRGRGEGVWARMMAGHFLS